MWRRTGCKADEEEIEIGAGVIICDKMPPFSFAPINSEDNAISHKVLILQKEPRMREEKAFGSLSVSFSFPGFTHFLL